MKIPVKTRHSGLLTKLLIGVLVIACVVLLVGQQSAQRANEAQAQVLADQISQLKDENQDLQEDIAGLGSDDSVENIARDELGLVGNGEVIFSDVGD